MSGMNILSCECECGDGCSCDVEQVHMSCGRERLEVHAELPEKGVAGVTYFVGNNTDGYVEYVWNDGKGFVKMGTAAATLIRQATLDMLGLARLSTAAVLSTSNAGVVGMNADGQLLSVKATAASFGTMRLSTDTELTTALGGDTNTVGGYVGMNANGQAVAMSATIDRYGTVRLGSRYQPTNTMPYVVGIGASSNDGKRGQLAFNLKPTQSDGSPGCLVYTQVAGTGESDKQYEMHVKEGSATQMGIVKLLGSLSGYTEEEINEKRNTHAASVGLVLDGIETFGEAFFTDTRLEGYFENWALGKDLASQIWENEEYRGALIEDIFGRVSSSEDFKKFTVATADAWLAEVITPEYVSELFTDVVVSKVREVADEHWTDDLDEAISDAVTVEVARKTESAIKAWMSDKENLSDVTDVVISSLTDDIAESASEASVEYTKGVFNGNNPILVDGEQKYFDSWASAKIQALVNSQTVGWETKLTALRTEVLTKVNTPLANCTLVTFFNTNSMSTAFTSGTRYYDLSGCRYIQVVTAWGWGNVVTSNIMNSHIVDLSLLQIGTNDGRDRLRCMAESYFRGKHEDHRCVFNVGRAANGTQFFVQITNQQDRDRIVGIYGYAPSN